MKPASEPAADSATVGFGGATGIGSWPGTDVAAALAVIRGELPDFPHLPELPDRGPGADLIGRTSSRLVGLAVDLQPAGWRLTSHPGRDQARAQAFWREDLDRFAAAFDGWSGPLKVQLAGPWTLAASLWLPRGERAVVDAGARRDLVASVAETASELLADVRRLLPQAQPVLQLDEPSLPAVLAGRLPTASGYGVLRAIPGEEVRAGLITVAAAIRAGGDIAAVHCCAGEVPIRLLAQTGVEALSLDIARLSRADWDALAEAIESGTRLWAGAIATTGAETSAKQAADAVWRSWAQVGLPAAQVREVTVTATCGLVGVEPQAARRALTAATAAARDLGRRAEG